MTMAMITTVATAVMTAVSAAIRFLCRGSNLLTTALPADGATGAAAASASSASLHCRRHQRHADLPASVHVWLCCDCAAAAGVKQSYCPFFSLSMSLPELSSAVRFCAVPCPSVRCSRSLPCGAALCGAVLCCVLCCTYSFIPGTCQVSFDEVSYNSAIAAAQQSSAVRCRALPCGCACRAVRYCAVVCRAVPCCVLCSIRSFVHARSFSTKWCHTAAPRYITPGLYIVHR